MVHAPIRRGDRINRLRRFRRVRHVLLITVWLTLLFSSGHNFGYGHSGELNDQSHPSDYSEYADNTGYMGISYYGDDWPRMCFNAAKSVSVFEQRATDTCMCAAFASVLTGDPPLVPFDAFCSGRRGGTAPEVRTATRPWWCRVGIAWRWICTVLQSTIRLQSEARC